MNKLENKNILYITHNYNSFEKDQIEIIAKDFKHVYVLVRYKPISEISKFIPINSLSIHRKRNVINLNNKPDNVTIIPVPLWYLPGYKAYKKVGQLHFNGVKKLIKKNDIKFDLVHAHVAWSAGFVGAKLKEIYKVPFLVTAHGYDIYELPFIDNEWKDKISYVLNSSDTILTVSKSNYKCIEKLGIDKNVEIIPNGYRSDLFYPTNTIAARKKLGLSLDRKIILNIGYLEKIKGHIYLLEAFKKIIKYDPNIMLYIIGDGSLKNKLLKYSISQKINKNIIFLGSKKHEEINDWLNASNLFVFPSLEESFGVAQIEAMACGKPVVATKNGGSEEIIISEEYGFLCERENANDLADKTILALNRTWNEQKIINYALKYRWENACEDTVQIYDRLFID